MSSFIDTPENLNMHDRFYREVLNKTILYCEAIELNESMLEKMLKNKEDLYLFRTRQLSLLRQMHLDENDEQDIQENTMYSKSIITDKSKKVDKKMVNASKLLMKSPSQSSSHNPENSDVFMSEFELDK